MLKQLCICVVLLIKIFMVECASDESDYVMEEPETFLEDPLAPLKVLVEENSKKLLREIKSLFEQSAEDNKDFRKSVLSLISATCGPKSYIKDNSIGLKKHFDNSIKNQETRIVTKLEQYSSDCKNSKDRGSSSGRASSAECSKHFDSKLIELKDAMDHMAEEMVDQQEVISDARKTLEVLKHSFAFLPRTCMDHKRKGFSLTDVYTIYPTGKTEDPVKVKCDMQDEGGGWMVFLERLKDTDKEIADHENFNRTYKEYEAGFGDVHGEYWLGLKWLNFFTSSQNFEMKVQVKSTDGGRKFVHYDSFQIKDASTHYAMTVDGFKGTLSYDSLGKVHKDAPFSTYDVDNDLLGSKNCASMNGGGWWYTKCHRGLLTATHSTSNDKGQKTLTWFNRGQWLIITDAVMKIREKELSI